MKFFRGFISVLLKKNDLLLWVMQPSPNYQETITASNKFMARTF